jgi:hypothetical protein
LEFHDVSVSSMHRVVACLNYNAFEVTHDPQVLSACAKV